MGSVVFTGAKLKIFLTASVEERARRRYKQLKDKGIDVSLPALSKDMADRDRRDVERSVAPLQACPDARILDTTSMSIEAVVSTGNGLGCRRGLAQPSGRIKCRRNFLVTFSDRMLETWNYSGPPRRDFVMTESFAELFEESLASQRIKPGTILTGNVIEVSPEVVIVSAGLKSEAVIPASQFMNEQGELEVRWVTMWKLRSMPSRTDSARPACPANGPSVRGPGKSSRMPSRTARSSQGIINGRVKGGFHRRDRFRPGLFAGLPRRHAPGSRSVVPGRQGTRIQDHQARPAAQQRRGFSSRGRGTGIQRGARAAAGVAAGRRDVKGVVKNLTDYGAFVDLGGIDGLLHITDMAWKRVKHPSEVVAVGDEIDVKILRFDKEKTRVSLGMKQLGADPWEAIARRYPPNTRLVGKVTNIADYGCFVEIEEGVEGLVHVSEMDWTNKNVNPSKVVTVGEEVEVMVLEIDEERRRISLGRQAVPARIRGPSFPASYNRNDRVTGTIKSITDFGVFIGLQGGIDGLVHFVGYLLGPAGRGGRAEVQEGRRGRKPSCWLSIRNESAYRSVSSSSTRIRLSKFLADQSQGQYREGHRSSRSMHAAAWSNWKSGIEGQLRASELSRDRVEDARTVLKARRGGRGQIHRDGPQDPGTFAVDQGQGGSRRSRPPWKATSRIPESTGGAGTSLGDLLKEKISGTVRLVLVGG